VRKYEGFLILFHELPSLYFLRKRFQLPLILFDTIMKKILILQLLFIAFCTRSLAQSNVTLTNKLLFEHFKRPESGVQAKRNFIKKQRKHQVMNTLAGGLIYFYQNIISAQIQADCAFETTCSQYIKLCIERYGFLKGTMSGLNQYMKCTSNAIHAHEEISINEFDKVKNDVNDEL
jgi:putative component of membrane protein insertase Oxa1/YidC/SpoIIIJ protein YidD